MKTLKRTKRRAMESSRRVSRPNLRARRPEPPKSASRTIATAGHQNGSAPVPQKPLADQQYQNTIKDFATGVRAFQKQNYLRAAEIFEKLVDSEARDVAERAQMHLRLCRQRTRRPASLPRSADDHYALGIACLNARNFERALEHLSKADRIKPNQHHVRYALSASYALAGNPEAAIIHLEAACKLCPENRIHARRDEDFQALSSDPRFRRLIFSDTAAKLSIGE